MSLSGALLSKLPRRRRRRDKSDNSAPTPSSTDALDLTETHADFCDTTEGGISVRYSLHKRKWEPEEPPPSDFLQEPSETMESNSFAFVHPESEYHIFDFSEAVPPKTRKRDNPLQKRSQERVMDFLRELLRAEGRGELVDRKVCCSENCRKSLEPTCYRCVHCLPHGLFCRTCIIQQHRTQPFHYLQEWKDGFFKKATLRDVDPTFFVQLGHDFGVGCALPSDICTMVVLHTTGFHKLDVAYCNCASSLPRDIQLLRFRLFPATNIDPRTAATFEVLHHFQVLSFMSKASAHEYLGTLTRLTDNTGLSTVPVRRREFLRMMREWRYLKTLKRHGHIYEEDPASTLEGAYIVPCPACPIPGVNLPDDWSNPENKWKHALFISLDANFKCKRLDVSSRAIDPPLNNGRCFLVKDEPYDAFLATYDDLIEVEKSTCSNFDAIKQAGIRGGKGLAIAGIAAAECRHDCRLAIVRLGKGERYVSMDYLLLKSLRKNFNLSLVFSYDIACQFFKNFFKRCDLYPDELTVLERDTPLTLCIGKYHLPGHIPPCRLNYSFNRTKHVGRTDGENLERGWAMTNALGTSIKEMGPGGWSDTLDDHIGDQNWRKTMKLVMFLRDKLISAVEDREEHRQAFLDACEPHDQETLDSWEDMVTEWEKDHEKPNPYEPTTHPLSLNAVRLRLAKEDEARPSDDVSVLHRDVTPAMLIARGLELEQQQRQLRRDTGSLSETYQTERQQTKFLERGTVLRRRIATWADVQTLYMPPVADIRRRSEEAGGELPKPFSIPLLLPSSIVDRVPVARNLLTIEWDLREADASDALGSLRSHLLCRTSLWQYRKRNPEGQRAKLRSSSVLKSLESSIQMDALRYRTSRAALLKLVAPLEKGTEWQAALRPLLNEDIRGFGVEEAENKKRKKNGKQVTDGNFTASWIWTTGKFGEKTKEEEVEALRIEWCKARARFQRYEEECVLLIEEMERSKRFFRKERERWDSLATAAIGSGEAESEGIRAYAKRQAAIRAGLLKACEEGWAKAPSILASGSEILTAGRSTKCSEVEDEDRDEASPADLPIPEGVREQAFAVAMS